MHDNIIDYSQIVLLVPGKFKNSPQLVVAILRTNIGSWNLSYIAVC
jgi:hypothetical protein